VWEIDFELDVALVLALVWPSQLAAVLAFVSVGPLTPESPSLFDLGLEPRWPSFHLCKWIRTMAICYKCSTAA
jgi:hypothetical protein